MKNTRETVENFKTKSEYGFTSKETEELLKSFPNINMEKFNSALGCHTVMIIDGEIITYHCDIITAITCSVEDRDINISEFD
jgi:hypothetical protein